MKALFRENLGEAITGLLVVVLAGWFVAFAWRHTGGGATAGGYQVTALFPNASGVSVGTDVRVSGYKVGSVTGLRLDPQSFQVAATLRLNPEVKLPADSSAAITSEGLLGGSFVAMSPGGAAAPLKAGDTITDTQGSLDLMSLIGQFINKPSSSGSSGGGPGGSGSGGGGSGGDAPPADQPAGK